MNYKPSIFNVVIKEPKEIILYNTLSTSSVSVTSEFYENYFEAENYGSDLDALVSMGFLVSTEKDEIQELLNIWKEAENNMNSVLSSIIIAPTMKCNAHCFYCFEKDAKLKTMTWETAQELVNFILENAQKHIHIHWFGGEPLLAPDLISKITNELKSNGLSVSANITTNGSLITEKIIQLFKNWEIDSIQITVDNIGDKYNEIKNYINENIDWFQIVINNIQLCLENNFKVNLRVNFNPENPSDAEKTIEFLVEQFSSYKNCYIYAAPITDKNIKAVTEEFFGEHPYYTLIKKSRENGSRFQVIDENGEEYYYDSFQGKKKNISPELINLKEHFLAPNPIPCFAINPNSIVIDPNGLIYRCHRLLGKGDSFACGNIFDKNERYNSMVEYFEARTFPFIECQTCAAAPLCAGGCKANRLLYNKEMSCCHVKAILKELVKDYIDSVKRQ